MATVIHNLTSVITGKTTGSPSQEELRFRERELCIIPHLVPISLQQPVFLETAYYKTDEHVSRYYQTKLAIIRNSAEESGARGKGGGNKTMDCFRRRILSYVTCATIIIHVITILMQSTFSKGTMCTTSY